MKKVEYIKAWAIAAGLVVAASPALAQGTAGGGPGGTGTGTGGYGSTQGAPSTEGGHERTGGNVDPRSKQLRTGRGGSDEAWEKWDRDQDRRISAREGRGLYEEFVAWDTDRDRSLAATEFHTGLYGSFDVDASGTVDPVEFRRFERWGFRDASDLAAWDRDGDGFIDRTEFDSHVAGVTIYDTWDRDRNQRLDTNELDAGYFALWDDDRDGYLDAGEYDAVIAFYDTRPMTGVSTTTYGPNTQVVSGGSKSMKVGSAASTSTYGTSGDYVTVSIPVASLTVDRLSNEPMRYFGDFVALDAEVEEKAPHVYAIDADGGDPELLVLVPERMGTLAEGQQVKIVGQIRPLVRAELERDFDWFDAGAMRELVRFDRRQPVLVASAILSSDGRSLYPTGPR
jgi:hypothetical protein